MDGLSRRDLVMGAGAVSAAPTFAFAAPPPSPGLARLQDALELQAESLSGAPHSAVTQVQRLIRTAAAEGVFDPWATPLGEPKSTVLGGGSGLRRWKVQIFRIEDGTSHPPHCHENLISCLVVLKGRLRVREYDRDRAGETEDWTILSPAFDGAFGPGEGMVTTEDHRNAHWFGAVGGPALAVNFKASGYVRPEFLRLRNRRYLDPTAAGVGGRAPFIGRADAHERFGRRSL